MVPSTKDIKNQDTKIKPLEENLHAYTNNWFQNVYQIEDYKQDSKQIQKYHRIQNDALDSHLKRLLENGEAETGHP
jgi:septal ring factor EnvC (AmiA/AmiB activator)